MIKFLKTYQLTISIFKIESCYFTRTPLQVFFTDFEGNFKNSNKTLAVHLHLAVAFENLNFIFSTLWLNEVLHG